LRYGQEKRGFSALSGGRFESILPRFGKRPSSSSSSGLECNLPRCCGKPDAQNGPAVWLFVERLTGVDVGACWSAVALCRHSSSLCLLNKSQKVSKASSVFSRASISSERRWQSGSPADDQLSPFSVSSLLAIELALTLLVASRLVRLSSISSTPLVVPEGPPSPESSAS